MYFLTMVAPLHNSHQEILLNSVLATSAETGYYAVNAADSFDFALLPGFSDGDCPPWLSNTAEDLLPKAFVESCGQQAASFVSGSWWQFPEGALQEMTEALRMAGFSVDLNIHYSLCSRVHGP